MHSKISLIGLAFALAACGGGDGSAPAPPTGGPPAPAPAPAPSPSPTPTPTPSVAFSAAAGAPLIARVIWDTNQSGAFGDRVNNADDLVTATNRRGAFGRDATGRLTTVEPLAEPTAAIQVGGVSTQTGFVYTRVTAPRGATIVSPVTSLFGTIDDDGVAANLGLGMSAAEISTFDALALLDSTDAAVAQRARNILALNLKLLAQAGFETTETGSTTQAIIVGPHLDAVRAQAQAAPIDFNSATSILSILQRSSRAGRTSAAGRRAAAALLATFGSAVDQHLSSGGRIADVEYALRIDIVPLLNNIFNTSAPTDSDLAKANTQTAATIRGWFDQYTEIALIPAASGEFVAVPDRVSMIGLRFQTFPAACSNPASFVCNDVTLSAAGPLNAQQTAITAVRVPPQYQSAINAELLVTGEVRVTLLQTIERIVWIEYDARDAKGNTSTSRAYIEVGQ
ncbi:hypothetical protein K3175_08845 [Qipengyuania sp. GH1]|uniref:hypothetical protein n=1 Tax=Qipengyuania aestuarii TaxID=2867241 RepID=UPI001C86DE11|nr:hypothetical protein [Qipengyuania aestuarii]MBX7535768.1 hypothetical protein [Qipengyuania aestuarii]